MLLPEKMCKITVVGMKDKFEKIKEFLYSKKVIHLTKVSVEKNVSPKQQDIRNLELHSKVNSLFVNLGKFVELKNKVPRRYLTQKEIAEGERIIKDFTNYFKRMEEIEKEIERTKVDLSIVEILFNLRIDNLSNVGDIRKHDIVLGIVDKEKYAQFKKNVDVLKKKHLIEVYVRKDAKSNVYYVMVIFPKDIKEGIGDLFGLIEPHYYLHDLYSSFKEYSHKVNDLYLMLSERVSELEEEYDLLMEKIRENYEKNKELLWSLRYTLDNEYHKIKGYDMFGEGDYLYYIQGYVPCGKVNNLIKNIKRIDESSVVKVEEVKEGKAPVMLKYPKILKGIHSLLEAYGIPAYRYIDPSLLMVFTFPLFYGFILGDIGYGAVLLLLSYIIGKISSSKGIKLLSNVLLLSSISTIIFGFVFGEFFGMESIFGYELHPLLHRMHDVSELIVISIVVGIFHINLGYLLGIFQSLLYKRYLDMVTHYISWIILEVSFGLIGYGVYSSDNYMIYGGILLGIVAVALIYYAEKLKGIFELPSIFTNLLSYVRLGAVGLSSVAIAYVINIFVEMFFSKGGVIGYLAAILIFAIGHTFNLLLGVIGPFLHTLRLHYVEFFTKFYKSGGDKYEPYGQVEEV